MTDVKTSDHDEVMMMMMMIPGNRCGLVWTLVVPEDGKGVEAIGVVADLSREGGDT